MTPTASGDDLQQRAWLAYLVQELRGPAETLRHNAASLAELGKASTDDHVATAVQRIRERADQLPDILGSSDRDRRTLRHDLRGAVGYVISACEDLAEDSGAALAAKLEPTFEAAKRLLGLIGTLTRFPADGASIDAMQQTVRNLPEAVASASAQSDRSEPARLLLIDDNQYNRDLVARMVQGLGHTVDAVAGGQEAIDRLSNRERPLPDLILCDLLMPGVTGFDVLRWLKADALCWAIPVIVVSALGDDDGVLACIAAGAEDYLTRPVRLELLRARIAGGLEKKRLRDREVAYQQRIDRLVQAIFPPAAVEEWRQNGAIKPRRYERVGVLFSDISGFTAWCEARRDRPEDVVSTLQDLIVRFEHSAAKHGVQKIKTIGDSFMAVAGLGDDDPNPALSLLRCGLDLIVDTAKHPAGWAVRVGVHVGPLVAGVLGQTQFTFDVWGHTVNAAARMESNGLPGRVTLSEDAWAAVKSLAEADERTVPAKGLGTVSVFDFRSFRPAP